MVLVLVHQTSTTREVGFELKSIQKWPRDGVVRVNHFNPAQRIWLQKRAAAGGECWLLLKVGADWLLFEGSVAAARLGRSTKGEMLLDARGCWLGRLDEEELLSCLKKICRTPNA